MADYFLDTSALGKVYHAEVGTPKVQQLLNESGAKHVISRLTAVEIQSVFARKVRTGAISAADFQILRRHFLTDVTNRRFLVARLTGFHLQEAERLIRNYGLTQNLRTLDAIQLSVALDLLDRGQVVHFVSADLSLCNLAATEGFAVIDPNQP